MPETYQNQKTITTKSAKHDKENLYAVLNLEAMSEAMIELTDDRGNCSAFKLWCYIAKNQNNYTFALSCVDACKFCGFGKQAYLRAVQKLIDVGYLVETSPNHYDFYEKLPQKEEIIITVKKTQDDNSFQF